jgi:anti-anti-sigma factor
MKFTIESSDNIVIFTLKNDNLDSRISADFKAELLIICQSDINALVLDLTAVGSIDSSGLGGILLAYRQLNEHEIPMILVGVQDMVRTIMDISRVSSQFVFFDTVNEALEYVADQC